MSTPTGNGTIYWHRELPPMDAEPMGEHTVEASSGRVLGTIDHRDDLWSGCYRQLMDGARARLEQEIARLGGDCAHVLDEEIDSRRDEASGEAWLRGRFTYVLYRRATGSDKHPRPRQEGFDSSSSCELR
jgi:hypothetical protein